MCGIVGYVGQKDVTDILINGLRRLEYRGYDSAGIAVVEEGNIRTIKSEGRLQRLENKLAATGKPTGSCGIGHTRWATHGEPSDINSHPHGNSNVAIVHNGIIENYLQLKIFLEGKGYEFSTDTDTETVAKLLDYYYHGDPIEAIHNVITAVRGSYALGILFHDFPDTIYATCKECPLIIGLGKGENFIVSDIPAILEYTKSHYLMEPGEIAIVTREKVDVVDTVGLSVEKEVMVANWSVESAEKGGYPHFMLKEIHEQPDAVRKTIQPRIVGGMPQFDIDNLTDEKLASFERIDVIACGTAMYAGLIGQRLIETWARIPVTVNIASEYRYQNPIFTKNHLAIIISQSGETADTLAALRLAKKNGAYTLAVVNVVGSSIAREADDVIYTWGGPEIAVASTKAYSMQVSIMYLLAIRLAYARGQISEETARGYCATLATIPEKMEQVLETQSDCQYFASEFQTARNAFVIGRGMDYAIATEASLKLKEISYVHSEAYAAGELKHGPIALIDSARPVIAIATQESLYAKTVSNIKAVRARGAKVLLLCKEGMEIGEGIAEYILRIPNIDDMFAVLPAIIPMQLFAYYSSILRGCDVDKPRNLAKSVTVE